jgi:uncharacterized protein (DUF1501 family)
MRISRRTFLKGMSASAALSSLHVLGLATRASALAGPGAPILVLVNLAGGNDLFNTIVPVNNVGAPQRTLYQQMRPDLAIPLSSLSGMGVGPDPVLGTGLALHPELGGLKQLYDQGRLACVLGAGLEGNSLSHFEAEKAWFFGRPDFLTSSTGWMGRHMDLSDDGLPHAVSFGGLVTPAFEAQLAPSLGVASVAGFQLPDDRQWEFRDGEARAATLDAIFGDARTGAADGVARAGRMLMDQIAFLDGIQTTEWGSALEADGWGPGADLREISSLLRHDELNPCDASGFCLYHVRTGGYDTHSRQGTLDAEDGHPRLLTNLSRWLSGFQQDLDTLGVADRVLTLVYSEFGRRPIQNANGNDAGTDHGTAGAMLLMGNRAAGGMYGAMPRLDQLDAHENLTVTTDFRRVYAAVIDDFLAGDHTAVLPGGPFSPLPLIQA